MSQNSSRSRIVILADLPVWTLPNLSGFNPIFPFATWLEALIPEFESQDHLDLHWITFSKEASKPFTHSAFGQTIHVLPRYKKIVPMLSGYLFESRSVKRLIKKLEPDLVHAWGSEDTYGISGARCRSQMKLFTLQGCLTECVKRDPHSHPLMKLQAFYEKRTVRAYRYGTGESALAVDSLTTLNPNMATRLIDYGVSRDFFAAVRNPADTPTVLFAGTVCAPKGINELVKVFSRPDFRNLILEIAGEGSAVSAIRALALPNVKFLGRLTRPALIEAMERAWLLAIPTHADTGPSILKEARVVGLPVITTTAAGAAHYISTSGAGEVIAPGADDFLAEAILKITMSKLDCVSIGRRDWDEHRDLFDPAGAARNFASLYRELISGG